MALMFDRVIVEIRFKMPTVGSYVRIESPVHLGRNEALAAVKVIGKSSRQLVGDHLAMRPDQDLFKDAEVIASLGHREKTVELDPGVQESVELLIGAGADQPFEAMNRHRVSPKA